MKGKKKMREKNSKKVVGKMSIKLTAEKVRCEKCVAARNEANDLRYENNGIRDKVREIESRVSGIERTIKKEVE